MATIKLLEIKSSLPNIRRFQSQLQVGGDTAGFIMEDGVMKSYGNGELGFNYYTFDGSYKIVENVNDMKKQEL